MSLIAESNFNIVNFSTFKIGGLLDEVYFPENIDEFVEILRNKPNTRVFGNLSNTLISSDGCKYPVILTTKMDTLKIDNTKVVADAGLKGPKLAQEVCKKGLSGLEFMIGFPGSVGGEVYMNASASGQCISDTLVKAVCYSQKENTIREYSNTEMNFTYRHSRCMEEDLIVLQAEFELRQKNISEIEAQMKSNLEFRKAHQPTLNLPNCGSIFKNPEGDSAGRLLDSVGAKEMSHNGVRVWANHANFIINDNKGSSTDVLELMYEMYLKVKQTYNVELEPEIRFLGGNNMREIELCKILYNQK